MTLIEYTHKRKELTDQVILSLIAFIDNPQPALAHEVHVKMDKITQLQADALVQGIVRLYPN
jgi:hypothetical protein